MWSQAKFRLLGHLIRAEEDHPMRPVGFEKDTSFYARRVKHRRVGREREVWIIETMKVFLFIETNCIGGCPDRLTNC